VIRKKKTEYKETGDSRKAVHGKHISNHESTKKDVFFK